MTQQRPTSPVPRQGGRLADALVDLAGTPDDHPGLQDRLVAIAQLVAECVTVVRYASVTARGEGGYTTVAASNDIAVAVDQAQYADEAGPCLEAFETARPLGVPDIAVTMRWPGFRDTAYRLGLHTSLSIPLFAGRGEPIAALNLYGNDPASMTALTAAVLATYDETTWTGIVPADLDPGGAELVAGLTDAFGVRATIQQAVGIIVASGHGTPEHAYAALRLRAADTGMSLLGTAGAIVAEGRY